MITCTYKEQLMNTHHLNPVHLHVHSVGSVLPFEVHNFPVPIYIFKNNKEIIIVHPVLCSSKCSYNRNEN